jgi:hypothetical protein
MRDLEPMLSLAGARFARPVLSWLAAVALGLAALVLIDVVG